jgi:hypothetical protein
MTATNNSPPLWEAMAEACANHPDGVVDLKPAVIQAMILAARDWLVPEERQALRAILTTEAKRAEAGPCQDKDGLLNL